jgi:IS30 family transposase
VPRGPILREDEKKTIRDLDKQGLAQSFIAERLGRHLSTISKFLRSEKAKNDAPSSSPQ